MEEMVREAGYTYSFEKSVAAGGSVIVHLPEASPNKKWITDIAWQSDSGDVTLYGTLSRDPVHTSLWDEIETGADINKAVYALKIQNTGDTAANVIVCAVMA